MAKTNSCRYCGTSGTDVHHIKTRGAGGTDIAENLIELCRICHTKFHAGVIDRYIIVQLKAKELRVEPSELCGIIKLPLPLEWPELVLSKEPPTLDEIIQQIITLEQEKDACQWLQGQIMAAAVDLEVKTSWIASQLNKSTGYVKERVVTWRIFPKEYMRVPELSWQHHKICAKTDKPYDWLREAADNQWSTKELQEAIRGEDKLTDEEKEMLAAEKLLEKVAEFIDKDSEAAQWLEIELGGLLVEIIESTGEEMV